jgi:uncharacterized protein
MPEYLSPGVYVEEVDSGSRPIEGVSTSTAGMIGVTERGPVGVPILITATGEFTRWFGERLDPADFTNGTGPHYYLPIAVDGFFTNGGKRIFVTRVLDAGNAVRSLGLLFDRGGPAAAATALLRSGGEVTGTAANPPPLLVVDATDLNTNDWARIGDGSDAEYQQIANLDDLPDPFGYVPLNLPLLTAHDVGASAEQIARAATGGLGGGFSVAVTSQPGDRTITVEGADADISALAGLPTPVLIEIGPADEGEHRRVLDVTVEPVTGATDRAALTLDWPLALEHASGEDATPLDMPLPPGNANQIAALGLDAAAGDRLVFLDDRNGEFDTADTLVVLDSADPERVEVRRIGDLRQFPLGAAAYEAYPDGAIVQGVTLTDDQRVIVNANPAAGDREIQLDDVRGLVAGQALIVDPGGTEERVVLRTVTPADPTDPLDGTVGLANPLAAGHSTGDAVAPVPTALTEAAVPGANRIAVANRVGLAPGSTVRLGAAPAQEYVRIRALPNPAPAGSGSDPGEVILGQPVRLAHANGAPLAIQAAPTPLRAPSALVIAAAPGTTALLVTDGNGYAADDVVRVMTPAGEEFFHRIDAPSAAAGNAPLGIAAATLAQPLRRSHPLGSAVVGRAPLFEVEALDPGAWGDRLRVSVEDEAPGLVARAEVVSTVNPTTIQLSSVTGIERGTVLEFLDANEQVVGPQIKAIAVDRTNARLTLAPPLTANQQNPGLHVRSREFRLTVYLLRQPDPVNPARNDEVINSEVFRWLSLDPRHSRYIETVIGAVNGPPRLADRRPEGTSWYVRVHDLAAGNQALLESVRLGPETLVDRLPNGTTRPARHRLEQRRGFDAIPTLTDAQYIGVNAAQPENRTGLHSLRNEEDISLVAAPGRTSPQIQSALIEHCEAMRYRFAVLDCPEPPNDSLNDVRAQRQRFDTRYAGLYYPWLLIANPFVGTVAQPEQLPVPPSGHVLGVFARTDIERGVHKAPANEVVRGGIAGLRRVLNKGEHDLLNPSPVNINVIRDFRPNNRGIRIWGARVITSDPDYKYLNVRRLVIFIERSIELGLQWVVFEPNAEPLWARVRQSVRDFLTVVWRNGALEGTRPEEAFFVRCDRTTMTQTDIDNGRLIVLIGIAPVKPAEFVIVRIGLWTAHSEQRAEG